MIEKLELFANVKRIREAGKLAGIIERVASPGTSSQEQYRRIAARDWQSGNPPMAGVSRSSWNVHRAALLWGYAEGYRGLMKAGDEAQKRGDLESALQCVLEAERTLERWMGTKDAVRPEEGPKRRSKRAQLPKAADWRAEVWKQAKDHEKAAIALLWATGLRPIELEAGADVKLVGGHLVVVIPGAKVSKVTGAGQPWRRLEIDRESAAGKALEAALEGAGAVTVSMGRRKLEAALERMGRQLKHKKPLTGYTFRHQLGADAKATLEPEAVAAAMGHVSTESQKRYGRVNQSKGGGAILRAEAAREVRGRVPKGPVIEGPD